MTPMWDAFSCYDRRRFRLYSAPQDFEFDTGKTLGTLSKLYDINF